MSGKARIAAKERAALMQWFGASKVADSKGNPLVVYRGEHGDTDDCKFQTRLGSISFGSAEAANTYALKPNNYRDDVLAARVHPVYLRIEKPFLNDRDEAFVDLGMVESALGAKEAMRVALKFVDQIENTNNWETISEETRCKTIKSMLKKHPERLHDLYFNAYAYFDDPEETDRLKAAGFDGAIHAGTGETLGEVEYKVFDESQVRSATTPWLGIEAVVRRLTSEGIEEDDATRAIETAMTEAAASVRLLRLDRIFVHADDMDAAVALARTAVMGRSPRT